ncbi:histidine--tRNA ligase [Candidatus Protochlamydia phocaeensis]|uniref:histidine--tRNA ligase n=1 Tax=Candidatus Protochlamydia phocaeensis TaxID=1414722 RepID=UPI000838A5F1|nr:histidine--tRNA ligase [Candidatus Protochlamydia phocaeensis]
MKYPIPPGVFDILPQDSHEPWKSMYLWSYVEQIIRDTARDYGYQEIRTPLFERTELFQRSVGETTDIVSKEMYTFEDKGGRSMSLRPEGTAPAMRAFIEHQLYTTAPIHKLFYIAPMFRYERTQAGRYRQHHQFGTEAIGNDSPEQDAEIIDLLYTLYQRLGLKNLSLNINSIGDPASRQAFRQALKDYLQPHLSALSPDSQNRFEVNPLRILDSKDPRDREIVAHAPSILDFLSEEARGHFEDLKKLLAQLKIPFQVNPLLVRGLDYYNKTVFEVVAGELGAQNSIGGGGRYDGLIQTLGGPDLPSIGFGTGIERIIQTMINQKAPLPKPEHPILFLVALGDEAKKVCFNLLHQLRQQGIPSQLDFSSKKVGKALQYADQVGATYVAVVGDQEIERQELDLKEMATGKKTKIAFEELIPTLKLEKQGQAFVQLWEDLSAPLATERQSQFFAEKLKVSLEQAKNLIAPHS